MTSNPTSSQLAELKDFISTIRNASVAGIRAVNMVPSEISISPLAQAIPADFANRYFFNAEFRSDEWHFRGGEDIASLEITGAAALRVLGAAKHVNMRPTSGMNAMMMIIASMSNVGGSVISLSSAAGGHYATKNVVEIMGRQSRIVSGRDGHFDIYELIEALSKQAVDLVYVDAQNVLSPIDVTDVVALLKAYSPNTALHVDCSHTLGLVFGGVHPNPLEQGALTFGGSTHKTMPGPHRGVLFTNSDTLAERIRRSQFYMVSSHHFSTALQLSLAAWEFQYFAQGYASNVIRNAQYLAKCLAEQGLAVAGTKPFFTETHQIWIDYPEVAKLTADLAMGGVRLNSQPELPGINHAAVRIGVNEATFHGATEQSMEAIAEFIGLAARTGAPVSTSAADQIRSTYGRPHYFEATQIAGIL